MMMMNIDDDNTTTTINNNDNNNNNDEDDDDDDNNNDIPSEFTYKTKATKDKYMLYVMCNWYIFFTLKCIMCQRKRIPLQCLPVVLFVMNLLQYF